MNKNVVYITFCILCGFLSAHASHPEVKVHITQDTTLHSSILIDEWTTVRIDPGVTVTVAGYYKIVVKGVLLVAGTADNPVTFTAVNRARGSLSDPQWAGIIIMGKKSMGVLTHCRIEGAYKNSVYDAAPIFDSCEFVGNHYALYCLKKATPHIKHCRIYRNVYGIVSDCSTPLLLGNSIFENTLGLYLQLGSHCTASKNSIRNNTINIKEEKSFGPSSDALSLQHLWDIMRELY